MRPSQRRDIAQDIVQEDDVSIARACWIVALDRSMFYYEPVKNDRIVESRGEGVYRKMRLRK